jgi:hypothetical protein
MEPVPYPSVFPHVGRVDTGLAAVQIQIVHSKGTLKLDANSAVFAAHTGALELGGPVAPSTLSGEPGYIYRSCEMQLVFTREELYRFMRHDLLPEEYRLLHGKFGSFFEIEPDFYDEVTGEALAPA